jgi:hypothetical protein
MHPDAEDRHAAARDDDGRAAPREIDPTLKQFIDAVIVPGLVRRLVGTPRSDDGPCDRRSDPTSDAPAQR